MYPMIVPTRMRHPMKIAVGMITGVIPLNILANSFIVSSALMPNARRTMPNILNGRFEERRLTYNETTVQQNEQFIPKLL